MIAVEGFDDRKAAGQALHNRESFARIASNLTSLVEHLGHSSRRVEDLARRAGLPDDLVSLMRKNEAAAALSLTQAAITISKAETGGRR